MMLRFSLLPLVAALGLVTVSGLQAQPRAATVPTAERQAGGDQCDFSSYYQAVWWGAERRMTLGQLVSYVAPLLWFSPDEPLLEGAEGVNIRIPEALPFETKPDAPVVYYQVEEVVGAAEGLTRDPGDPGEAVVDFERIHGLKITFFAYYSSEVGLGAHQHDLEASEFKLLVMRNDDPVIRQRTNVRCAEPGYVIAVTRVTAKAHGIIWFWNVLDTDRETRFPMSLLVEEGKHALGTDKNSDGYFTPGYDVSRHVNDAWGTRDVIRGGMLFTGGYQAWMTKVRRPEHRVLPPLPADSPLWPRFRQRVGDPARYAVYELRPLPAAERAGDDQGLHHFMDDKEVPGWPEMRRGQSAEDVFGWLSEGSVVKSFAVSLYVDGDLGFAFAFPLFIVKNFEDPMTGGFIVHRMYLKDDDLRDFGWMALYTPSASRWIDTYLAAGAEWDKEVVNGESQTDTEFVLETGVKFRVNISTSAFKFLGVLTDFWGLRAGIKNKGFFDIDHLTYVFEFGAGAW